MGTIMVPLFDFEKGRISNHFVSTRDSSTMAMSRVAVAVAENAFPCLSRVRDYHISVIIKYHGSNR